jgi:hypothetical protein
VIWLLRHLKPDFKTIADFRRDNRNAFRPIFRQFVLLCRQLDLFGRELLAVDGTRIKAVNNKDSNFTRASLTKFIELADAKLHDYLQRLDQSDATGQMAPEAWAVSAALVGPVVLEARAVSGVPAGRPNGRLEEASVQLGRSARAAHLVT